MASVVVEHQFVMGERVNSTFLYVKEERQLYTFNANGKLGKTYRCANRSCKSRVIFIETKSECVKLSSASDHNHSDNCEERFVNLVAMEQMKRAAMDLHTIAGGSKLTKSRAIYNSAIIE